MNKIASLTSAVLLSAFAVTTPPAAGNTVQVDGASLHYVEKGSGVPVIFVHGAISDSRGWEAYLEVVSAGHRAIAYDQRYFGPADWPDDGQNFQIDTHVGDLIAVIEALDAEPAHVVSWSYSGGIATRAALKRPDLFRSLVHFEPSENDLLKEIPGSEAAKREMFARFGPAMAAVEEGRNDDAALRFLETVFRMPEGAAEDEPEKWQAMWRENGRTIPPFMAMKTPEESVTCEKLQTLSVPTLVAMGSETYTRYAMMAEQIARCQPNALLVTMEGVGHDGPYRRQEEFQASIGAFLSLVE